MAKKIENAKKEAVVNVEVVRFKEKGHVVIAEVIMLKEASHWWWA